MDKTSLDFVIEKTHELMKAPTCCNELKAAAQAWLNALGTDHEAAETVRYFDELSEDIVALDDLIALAGSDAGVQYFGAELAHNIEAHGKEIKAEGAVYCDCPACAAAELILAKKDCLLK